MKGLKLEDQCACEICSAVNDERQLAREWILRMGVVSFLAGALFAATLMSLLLKGQC